MVEAITFGALPRRKPTAAPTAPAPVPVAPAYDLGDYGDPAFLDRLAIKQLEVETLSQIVTVKRLSGDVRAMEEAGHNPGALVGILAQETAKGKALREAWERRGRTMDDLRGKSPEFKGIN